MAEWVKEGLAWLANVAIREKSGVSIPANFYVGLSTISSGTETSTLATLGATSFGGTGYARKPILSSTAGWPTLSTQSTNNQRATSATVQFRGATANDWDPARVAYLCEYIGPGSSGTLIAWSKLSAARDLTSTSDTLDVTFNLDFKG
jgi:hypothetical protein